jgi:hypothetical protein
MSVALAEPMDVGGSRMFSQALWFFLHSMFSVLTWAALMFGITLCNPDHIAPVITLSLSLAVPLVVGFIFVRIRSSDVATLTWLAGLIWFMIVGLWILDMPTGPGACYHCGASDKVWLTFFSLTEDSGMIDGQGRFFGTWPVAAMIGYSIGAKLAMRGREMPFQQPL